MIRLGYVCCNPPHGNGTSSNPRLPFRAPSVKPLKSDTYGWSRVKKIPLQHVCTYPQYQYQHQPPPETRRNAMMQPAHFAIPIRRIGPEVRKKKTGDITKYHTTGKHCRCRCDGSRTDSEFDLGWEPTVNRRTLSLNLLGHLCKIDGLRS